MWRRFREQVFKWHPKPEEYLSQHHLESLFQGFAHPVLCSLNFSPSESIYYTKTCTYSGWILVSSLTNLVLLGSSKQKIFRVCEECANEKAAYEKQ